jgi:hypothetical protein
MNSEIGQNNSGDAPAQPTVVAPVSATPTILTPVQAQVQHASQEAFRQMFIALMTQYVSQGMESNAAAAQVCCLVCLVWHVWHVLQVTCYVSCVVCCVSYAMFPIF